VPFTEAGYLFLASTEGGAQTLRENHAAQAIAPPAQHLS
jgi:hypothetical protein